MKRIYERKEKGRREGRKINVFLRDRKNGQEEKKGWKESG